jgi:hypothetical protein
MVVPTIAVFMALTSSVGDGAAPTLQAVRVTATVSSVIRICRGNFLIDIWIPPIGK